MGVRAVLFDMDGVLIDSYRAWRGVVDDARVRFGRAPLTDAAFAAGWGQGLEADVDRWFPGEPPAAVAAVYHERFGAHVDAIDVMAGAAEVLQVLRTRSVACACVTNTPGGLARTILSRLALAAYLDPILGGDEVAASKPAPDLLFAALERLGCDTAEAVFVGDTDNDTAAAAAAGVRLLGFGQRAGIPIARLAEIPELIARLPH